MPPEENAVEEKIDDSPDSKKKIPNLRKAAILMISLDEEAAAAVFKLLDRADILRLSMEIAKIESLRPAEIRQAVEEFHALIMAREYVKDGGFATAKSILENAFGAGESKEVIERMRNSLMRNGFVSLKNADSTQLANFLTKEHPQTIALILSYLSEFQIAAVLSEIPEQLRQDVAYRIATLGKVSPQILRKVEETVEYLAESIISEDMSKTGGADALAAILNQSNKVTEKSILKHIEELDPELANEVKSQMFVFDDIASLDDRAIQKLLTNVDKKLLSLALKAADEPVADKILKNMSERAAELLQEDLQVMGPVRLRDIEEAQRKVLEILKQLEEDGEIMIGGKGGDDVIIS